MRTLAVIPARLGSTRLPRKPLRLLGGEPLIARVWERVRTIETIGACVVATDSAEVSEALRGYGADVVLTSPNHESGTERVAEVARSARFRDFEIIVNIQGDEPFVSASAVSAAVRLVSDNGYALATVAARAPRAILDDPNVVKVAMGNNGRALYFSRAPIPYLRDSRDAALRDSHVLQHAGVYVYSRDALRQWVDLAAHPLEQIERLEQLRPLAHGMTIGIAVIDEPLALGIDTEDDLVRANEAWATMAGHS